MELGFVLHPSEPRARQLFEQAQVMLARRGAKARELGAGNAAEQSLGAVVSLGGDGTMLRAMAIALEQDVPVLGVNLGQLGYLAEVEPAQIAVALESLLQGSYQVDERLYVEVEPLSGGLSYVGFNDVVVERRVSGHLIRADVTIAGHPFLRYAADGLIVATPTGSTAYSFSAHGPVISPRVEALVLTPLAAHQLFDRPLVLALDEAIEVRILGGPEASVMVDGVPRLVLTPGTGVRVQAGPRRVRVAQVDAPPFHEVLKAKFGLEGDGGRC